MNMSKGISGIKMLDANCPRCMQRDKKQVKLFNIEFESVLVNEVMAGFLPEQDNTAGQFCLFVGCDAKYEALCEETRKLPNKQTFGGGASQ